MAQRILFPRNGTKDAEKLSLKDFFFYILGFWNKLFYVFFFNCIHIMIGYLKMSTNMTTYSDVTYTGPLNLENLIFPVK